MKFFFPFFVLWLTTAAAARAEGLASPKQVPVDESTPVPSLTLPSAIEDPMDREIQLQVDLIAQRQVADQQKQIFQLADRETLPFQMELYRTSQRAIFEREAQLRELWFQLTQKGIEREDLRDRQETHLTTRLAQQTSELTNLRGLGIHLLDNPEARESVHQALTTLTSQIGRTERELNLVRALRNEEDRRLTLRELSERETRRKTRRRSHGPDRD